MVRPPGPAGGFGGGSPPPSLPRRSDCGSP